MVNDEGALESFTGMLIGLLLVMVLTFAAGFALITQYQRGRTAADLGALAAAGAIDPCSSARLVVERNGARLRDCQPGVGDVRITVAVPAGIRGLALPSSITVSARAGVPLSAVPPPAPTVTP